MKIYSFLVAFFIVFVSVGQDYKGAIKKTNEDGLYKILLTPEIRSACSENFNFLRIKNDENIEIPYVLRSDSDKLFSSFERGKMLSKKVHKDSVTSIVIARKKDNKQTGLILEIANTNITKKYNVYGSDNAKEWYGLTANNTVSFFNNSSSTSIEKEVNFPPNLYKYIKIDFNDQNSLPINVLNVGVYKSKFFSLAPVALNFFTQEKKYLKDKKVTRLKFNASNSHKINTISFKINTDIFLRNAKLIVTKTRKIKKRTENYEVVLSSFQLNSKHKNTFSVTGLQEKEFVIEIDDQDNQPLDITSVLFFQKPIYLISNLKKNKDYEVFVNKSLKKPSYDLENFISNKTTNIMETSFLNLEKIKNEVIFSEEKPFWKTNAFMWICISLGGIIVVYFATSLLKDIKRQD